MRHRDLAVLAAFLVVAVTTATGPGANAALEPTHARSVDAAEPAGSVRLPAVGTSAARAAHALEQWTPDRMRAARPMPALRLGASEAARMVASREVEPLRTTVRPGRATARRAATTMTAGKLFFTNEAGDNSCSASALNGRSKSLVLTAGHCVHSGGPDGTFSEDFVFVPGYDDGRRPKGVFVVVGGEVLPDWVDYGRDRSYRGYNSDVAILAVGPNQAGRRLGQVVNTHGLAVGGRDQFTSRLFAYPANKGGGEEQLTCAKRTEDARRNDYTFRFMQGCGFGPGASGGAWLAGYDASTGVGTARGLVSFGNIKGSNDYMGSPYLTSEVERLRKRVDARVDD